MARFTSTSTPHGPSSFHLHPLEPRLLLTQTYTFANAPITGGGFVDGIEFSPAQQDLVYARTDVGGGYRWNVASNSWIPLNDALGRNDSQLLGVISLAPDPSNANNVYEAVGQYTESCGENWAILYSTDQGAPWGRTNLPFRLGGNDDGREAGERLQVDPNNGSILFLGTNNNGLWRSTDSGQTWAKVTTFPSAATSLTFVLFDKRSGTAGNATQTVYVGVNTLTGTNLYRTTNGGTTWAAVPNEPTGKLAFQAALDSAGSLYVTYDNNLGPNNVTAGAVERLNTATGAWTVITPPTGQGGFAGVSVDPAAAGTLIVTTTDRWFPHDQIYRSTDLESGTGLRSGRRTRSWTSPPRRGSTSLRVGWMRSLLIRSIPITRCSVRVLVCIAVPPSNLPPSPDVYRQWPRGDRSARARPGVVDRARRSVLPSGILTAFSSPPSPRFPPPALPPTSARTTASTLPNWIPRNGSARSMAQRTVHTRLTMASRGRPSSPRRPPSPPARATSPFPPTAPRWSGCPQTPPLITHEQCSAT